MSKQKITLGLSMHRPEMVPFLADWMKRHDAVVLEEPPDESFEQMIYSKLVAKEESTEDLNSLPHLRDELACIQIARRLSTDDCRRLFPVVRGATSSDARQIVAEYLAE